MQLLAHSAQQLQQQQQRRQQELFNQGSSSAALQQLAKFHQQKEQGVEMAEDQSSYESKSVGYSAFPRNDNVKVEDLPKSVQMSVNTLNQANLLRHSFSPSTQASSKQQAPGILNYTNWTITGRATPEFERGHIRDLSFGSQDSPILGLQSSDIIKNSSKPYHKPQVAMPVRTAPADPEPELKSPLDHPDQLEQHRNRFFSSDSGPASGGEQAVGEAALNENDKKAVAAIGKLMEMGEKISTTGHGNLNVQTNTVTMAQHAIPLPINTGTPIPYNVLQMQELIRNTPPPPYEQSNLLSGSVPMHFPTGHVAPAQAPVSLTTDNNEVKQEPHSPSKASRNFYLAEAGQYKPGRDTVGLSEEQVKFLTDANTDLQARYCISFLSFHCLVFF